MNPFISVGLYLTAVFLVFLQAELWLYGLHLGGALKAAMLLLPGLGVLLSLMPVAGTFLPDGDLKFTLQAAGNIWLGYFAYMFMTMLVLEIILLVLMLVRHHAEKTRPAFLLLIVTLIPAVITVYGMLHASDIHVNHYDIRIEKDAGGLTELKLVLIADLHMSVNSSPAMIRDMVDKINAEEPDVVVVAGDIFTSSYGGMRQPGTYASILRDIRAKEGVYAVYGNHDVEEALFGGFPITPISEAFRPEEMEQFFLDAGFQVLYDETVTVGGGHVLLAGRADGEKAGNGTAERLSPAELLKDTDEAMPCLILQHEPVEFAALKEAGADLALCGHTHNGQIFPGNLIVPFFNENAYGYKKVAGLDTIVTSGIGFYGPPMRVGTDSEIAVIQLQFG